MLMVRTQGCSASGARIRSLAVTAVTAAMLATTLAAPAGAQTGATCDGQAATIVGTGGDDTIIGTAGNDVIVGLGGNDSIDGLDGDDVICGDEGNDIIRGGMGADRLLGGPGNDIMRGQQSTDFLDGGDGNDTLRGNNGADTITGRNGNDTLLGGKGQDVIRGGNGIDEIGGGGHDDTIFGGAGDDEIRGGNGSDVINTGGGDDDVRGGRGNDEIFTDGSTLDIIDGGVGSDFIDGVAEELFRAVPVPPINGNSFFYEDFGGETFTGEIYGLVDVGVSQFGPEEEGTCYLVVGEIRPETIDGPVSSGFDTPDIGLIVGGQYIADSVSCERAAVDRLGYSWILDAEATVGTDIPFFAEVFVPEGQGAITDVIVGNPVFLDDSVTAISPAVLSEIPTPTGLGAGPLPGGPEVGPNATFEYVDRPGDATWIGQISSVVSAPVGRFVDEPGRCFLVLGTLTPTVVEGLVSNGFTTPQISALVDGRNIDDGTECDTSAVEAQGFGWILDAEVTVATPYQFYAEIFVPEAFSGDPTRILVGRASEDASVFVN